MTGAFTEVVSHTIGGGWGNDEPSDGDVAVRIIRGADFPAASLFETRSFPVRFEPTEKVRSRRLLAGDIVLETSGGTKDRPTGRTIHVNQAMVDSSPEPLIPASFCRLIRIDRSLAVPKFVYYALQDLHARGGTWEFQNQSTGISNFQYEVFKRRYCLPTRDLAEQQGIANVLGPLDDKIAANANLAATADDLLAARLRKALASEGDTNSVLLGDIAGVNERTVKPLTHEKLRYVDIATVGVGKYALPPLTDWKDAPGRARRGLTFGDTIWSTVRPNRRSHALNLSNDPHLVASTGLAVLTPQNVGFAYLYEVTRLPEFTAYLENVAEGSTYPAVRADRFSLAPIPLLREDARDLFEEFAAPLRQSIHALDMENDTLAATRDALLPALMSGALRVRDAERVVESAL